MWIKNVIRASNETGLCSEWEKYLSVCGNSTFERAWEKLIKTGAVNWKSDYSLFYTKEEEN